MEAFWFKDEYVFGINESNVPEGLYQEIEDVGFSLLSEKSGLLSDSLGTMFYLENLKEISADRLLTRKWSTEMQATWDEFISKLTTNHPDAKYLVIWK